MAFTEPLIGGVSSTRHRDLRSLEEPELERDCLICVRLAAVSATEAFPHRQITEQTRPVDGRLSGAVRI
jgi:hypothetical protein